MEVEKMIKSRNNQVAGPDARMSNSSTVPTISPEFCHAQCSWPVTDHRPVLAGDEADAYSVHIHELVLLLEADRLRPATAAVMAAPVLSWSTHTSLTSIAGAVGIWTQ